MLEHAQKMHLNKYTHAVRASQAVLQYGVGAMVDFPDQTLMTAAPEYWQEQVVQIHDERLERALHVDYFGMPMGQDNPNCKDGISYVRFPEWYFCPKCRRFQPLNEWIKEYKRKSKAEQLVKDPEMIKHMQCPTCKQDLVVSRIVVVCKHGHIDDFPWIQWVHCKNMNGPRHVCDHPLITFKTSATSSEGLEGLTVTCEHCHAKATLHDAFDKGVFERLDKATHGEYGFSCSGRHPWKNTRETCDQYPRTMVRGGSSVYFPITQSSLVIPPYSSMLTRKIEESTAFAKCRDSISMFRQLPTVNGEMLKQLITGSLDQFASNIALEIGVSASQIKPILKRKWLSPLPEDTYTVTSVKYRAEEYEALTGEAALPGDRDFQREPTDIADYGLPGVKSISLIRKICEVQALTGFSRINPIEKGNGTDTKAFVSVKQPETNWYPAYQVRGEGIFIELDSAAIDAWIRNKPEISERAAILNESIKKSEASFHGGGNVTPKFLLLHTLSHLLIKQLSFECGYGIASLRERLYCSDASEGKQMAGILVYTASGDSEGTMGGLVRQGRSDVFPGIFKKAVETAVTCSNDPVCSLSMGQGRESLNLAACYSCCLIPETSCEEFNVYLDRAMVVGTYEDRTIGFYADQLFGGESWTAVPAIPEQGKKNYEQPKPVFILTDNGIDVSESTYASIWTSLYEYADNETEIALLDGLRRIADEFSGISRPRQDCGFMVSRRDDQFKCDLYWPAQKVALFAYENQDSYEAAKTTDVKCFYTGDTQLTPTELLYALKAER